MRRFAVAATLSALAAGACAGQFFDGGGADMSLLGKSRAFEFEEVARAKAIPAGAKRLELWLPVPREESFQSVTAGVHVVPVEPEIVADPATGNRFAHFVLEGERLAPFEARMRWRVVRRERVTDDLGSISTDAPSPRDLAPDRLVAIDGEVAERARTAVGDASDPVEKGRRIYRDVLQRMRYSRDGVGWGNGDVKWACREGYGNCSDFHALFIGMARSQGLPARFTMGFPLPPEHGTAKIAGYHCWAEFFAPGVGWIPIDASEADKHPELADYYFGSLTADRVEFTRGRDLKLAPPQSGPDLNFCIYPYAEIDRAPFAGVEREFVVTDAGSG